jgi:hypothetical protein
MATKEELLLIANARKKGPTVVMKLKLLLGQRYSLKEELMILQRISELKKAKSSKNSVSTDFPRIAQGY